MWGIYIRVYARMSSSRSCPCLLFLLLLASPSSGLPTLTPSLLAESTNAAADHFAYLSSCSLVSADAWSSDFLPSPPSLLLGYSCDEPGLGDDPSPRFLVASLPWRTAEWTVEEWRPTAEYLPKT